MEPEVEAKMRKELIELQQWVQRARKGRVDNNEIEQHADQTELTWLDRMNDAERYELRGSRVGIREAVSEMERQAQQQRDVRDNAALPPMDRDNQVYFWGSNRSSSEPSAQQQREQSRLSDAVFEHARSNIQERYSNLREGMQQAVHDILRSKEPDLSFLRAEQMNKEQEQARTQDQEREAKKAAFASLVSEYQRDMEKEREL